MSDDFSTKYKFSDEEFNDKFEEIWKEATRQINISKNKSAYVLGGQPGAGKSSLINSILKDKFNDNAIVISGDDFRRYHPRYDEIQKNEGKLAAKYTQNFSSKITEKLIENASDKGYNLIVEGTFRTETTPIKTLLLLKDKGYDTNIAIKACDKDISWQSCLERYEKQKQINSSTARYTNKEDHDIVVENISENAAKVFETGLANSIFIQNRQGKKTEISFDKNLVKEKSNKIKNLLDNEKNN
ncbi:zeta toxin superfamily protein [Campylobacter sputorum subsp. bubulus]|uniref:Zeta toxin superfamily protein n=1 Tax=Campylobacter sputorum subsp. sputorum TaxID=32024 RepID=A0A381DJV1_9BACT|nr:zeta toxin family protein [Campylobacter sputorum]ASM35782.1 zeta toxin family protein [Campylobacter sputorum aubsp. sputorum RM3237]ASM37481.1 zeta toxin family protein [Campylobacter sputorum bv. faecalis CCUG 20703]KAB0581486.1 AAA family ATPase [Campylobacter sputorum subsp. sputorum]QEL05972.1 zeta toxin domain-containing protein [Campylobacter sputorum subsp. sputorum]SUX09070.1 zeta toxin superfamily protein [Campylobacter sputorum subsp. bubulus]